MVRRIGHGLAAAAIVLTGLLTLPAPAAADPAVPTNYR